MMDKILSLTPIPTLILDPRSIVRQVSRGFTSITKLDSSKCIDQTLQDITSLHPLLNTFPLDFEIQNAISSKTFQYTEPYAVDQQYFRIRTTPIYAEFDTPSTLLFLHLEFEDHTEETIRNIYFRKRLSECETF